MRGVECKEQRRTRLPRLCKGLFTRFGEGEVRDMIEGNIEVLGRRRRRRKDSKVC